MPARCECPGRAGGPDQQVHLRPGVLREESAGAGEEATEGAEEAADGASQGRVQVLRGDPPAGGQVRRQVHPPRREKGPHHQWRRGTHRQEWARPIINPPHYHYLWDSRNIIETSRCLLFFSVQFLS